MTRGLFFKKRFQPATLRVIEHCNEALAEYRADPTVDDVTVRQLYYRLVSRDLIINTDESYKRLGGIVNDARLAGLMDWDMIVDRGRRTIKRGHWRTPQALLEAAHKSFAVDRWEYQPIHVEVMCEKQALEGVFAKACARWDLPFTANKGYSSASSMYRKGKEFEVPFEDGRTVFILYFGDFDPSGLDMDRDVRGARLGCFVIELSAKRGMRLLRPSSS